MSEKVRTYNCPCCDSDNTTYLDAPDIYDDEVFIEVMCQNCDATWKKHFYYDNSEVIEEGRKMDASYEFEHELGKKVWVMLNNVPSEVEIFEHKLIATLYTYKNGLCSYIVKYGEHVNQRKEYKTDKIFNSKAELVASL